MCIALTLVTQTAMYYLLAIPLVIGVVWVHFRIRRRKKNKPTYLNLGLGNLSNPTTNRTHRPTMSSSNQPQDQSPKLPTTPIPSPSLTAAPAGPDDESRFMPPRPQAEETEPRLHNPSPFAAETHDPFQKPTNPDAPVTQGHLYVLASEMRAKNSALFVEVHNKPAPPTAQQVAQELAKIIQFNDKRSGYMRWSMAILACLSVSFMVLYFTKTPASFTKDQVELIAERMAEKQKAPEVDMVKLASEIAKNIKWSDDDCKKVGQNANVTQDLTPANTQIIVDAVNKNQGEKLKVMIEEWLSKVVPPPVPETIKADITMQTPDWATGLTSKVESLDTKINELSSVVGQGVTLRDTEYRLIGKAGWEFIVFDGLDTKVNDKPATTYWGAYPDGTSGPAWVYKTGQ